MAPHLIWAVATVIVVALIAVSVAHYNQLEHRRDERKLEAWSVMLQNLKQLPKPMQDDITSQLEHRVTRNQRLY